MNKIAQHPAQPTKSRQPIPVSPVPPTNIGSWHRSFSRPAHSPLPTAADTRGADEPHCFSSRVLWLCAVFGSSPSTDERQECTYLKWRNTDRTHSTQCMQMLKFTVSIKSLEIVCSCRVPIYNVVFQFVACWTHVILKGLHLREATARTSD